MLFLFLLLGAAVVAVLVWRTTRAGQAASDPDAADTADRSGRPALPWSAATRPGPPPRASGPDDDPEFLRQLDKKVRGGDDDQPSG